jgi:hypothetical protein
MAAPAPQPVVPDLAADAADVRAAQDELLRVERGMVVTEDPSAPMFKALASFAGVLHRASLFLADSLARQAAAEADRSPRGAVFSDQQMAEIKQQIARAATRELPGAVDRLVLQRYRRLVFAMAAALVVAAGLGAGVVWWSQPTLRCLDQNGGRICYVWTIPPTTPPR